MSSQRVGDGCLTLQLRSYFADVGVLCLGAQVVNGQRRFQQRGQWLVRVAGFDVGRTESRLAGWLAARSSIARALRLCD